MWMNILSNAVFLLLFVAIAGAFLLIRRALLLSLFQVSGKRGLIIYLSRLQIQPGGACGFNGLPRSFSGPAFAVGEMVAASALRGIFEYLIPGFDSLPGILKTLFTRDISVGVEPAPQQSSQMKNDCTIIAVGSPAFNCVSDWIPSSLNPLIRFDSNNSVLVTNRQQPITDPREGMVQVLWDANHNRRVFYIGGITEAGTTAGLMYLARKWKELKRNLGNSQVYACTVRMENGEPILTATFHP